VGDTGVIVAGDACRIEIRDTQKKLGNLLCIWAKLCMAKPSPAWR